MIFPPILNYYYPMKGKIFVIKKRSKGLTKKDALSQHSLIIFTKGANIFVRDCMPNWLWFKKIYNVCKLFFTGVNLI